MNIDDNIYTYLYDDFGSISKLTLNNNTYYEYIYDLARRLERIIHNNYSIKYTYDKNNNITNKTYDLKKPESLITNVINYEYNQDDNITKLTIDGNTINYNYDYLGRLTNKNINDNLQMNYTYITKGDRTSLIINTYTIGNDTYKYEYDEVYNITKIYLNDTLINEYTYDHINELISERNNLSKRKYQYVYDTEGNIVVKKEYNLETNEILKTYNYEYNNPEWEDQLTKFNDEVITYDKIGNPLSIGESTLTWKVGRRLTTYTKGDLNISYDYNVDGIRTSKTVNGQTTNYILEGKNIIVEENPKGMLYYIYDNNEIIGLKYNNQTYFYKKNLQGDIIGLYNSNFEQIVTYTYDSWGKVITVTDTNGNEITDESNIALINPFRYRSYYYDKETELYYLNSRYYNPTWGRFINADGILGNLGVIFYDLYNYCDNNPINRKDSQGSFWTEIKEIINSVVDVIKSLSPVYAGIGGVTVIDGPLPFADAVAAIGAVVLTVGVIGYATYKELTTDKTDTKVDVKDPEPKLTPIYRWHGTNPGNYVPRKTDHESNGCLSFSIIPKSDSGMTTMEAVNATGILTARIDGKNPTHVAVCPTNATVKQWREAGVNSMWTQTLLKLIVKWEG